MNTKQIVDDLSSLSSQLDSHHSSIPHRAIMEIENLQKRVRRLEKEKAAVRKALRPFHDAINESSDIYYSKRDSWHPKAHIEITVTATEAFAAHDVLKARKHHEQP